MLVLNALGSMASILGLIVSIYVLWRELQLGKDLTTLKNEEEQWRKDDV
jgi:hypothetical protein